MKILDLLADLERRAAKQKTTLPEVCTAAGLAASTVRRWRAGLSAPTQNTYRFLVKFMDGEAQPKLPRKRAA